MAQQVIVTLVDDLDGSEAEETVTFGLDGAAFEIDLSFDNADRLREALREYVEHGRQTSGGRRSAGSHGKKRKVAAKATAKSTPASHGKEQLRAIREWARRQGHDVSDRGRIAGDVVAAFDEAHAA